jgi:hypothetical protein
MKSICSGHKLQHRKGEDTALRGERRGRKGGRRHCFERREEGEKGSEKTALRGERRGSEKDRKSEVDRDKQGLGQRQAGTDAEVGKRQGEKDGIERRYYTILSGLIMCPFPYAFLKSI